MPETQETRGQSLGWEDPWRRKWQPTPGACLENPMDRRPVGYNPLDCKELDTTERQSTAQHTGRWSSQNSQLKSQNIRQKQHCTKFNTDFKNDPYFFLNLLKTGSFWLLCEDWFREQQDRSRDSRQNIPEGIPAKEHGGLGSRMGALSAVLERSR